MHKVDENRKFCVYKHTSPSGKCYIGITCQNPIKRWGTNGNGYFGKTKKSGKYLHPYFVNAIQKYGWDNFTHEILYSDLNELQAKTLEQELIKYYKEQNLSYNITDGGEGVLGVHHIAWNKGIVVPEEKKRKGFNLTDEHKQKLSIAHKGKVVWPPARAVNLYTADGQYLDTYERCSDLARYLETGASNINQAVLGKVLLVKDCQVKYIDDNRPLHNIDYYTKLASKPVELYDIETDTTYIFDTIYAASRYTKIPQGALIGVAVNRKPRTRMVTCKYLNNDN